MVRLPCQLAPDAIMTAWREAAYRGRERMLEPVTTIQLFVVHSIR